MKAGVYDKKATPFPLEMREVAKPNPAEGEVLVKIHAVSINAADYRSMRMGMIPKRKIYGADIAGRIGILGAGVTKFKIGDRVFGDIMPCDFGGFAEYAAVPEGLLALIPTGVSFEDAAAVPIAALTALQGLRTIGNVQRGQKVLICGASGGVGTYAVQLAKYFGAEVTAVCSPKNERQARSLGADHVIDYSKEDFSATGKRYDLILAINGNRSFSAYKRALAPAGTCVMVGGALTQIVGAMLLGPIMSIGSKKIKVLAARSDPKDLEFLIKLVKEDKIKPVIERRYKLEETPEAMHYASKGHASGKIVITVAK